MVEEGREWSIYADESVLRDAKRTASFRRKEGATKGRMRTT